MNTLKVLLPYTFMHTFAEDGAGSSGAGDAKPASGDAAAANASDNADAGKSASTPSSGQGENKTVPLAALHEERSKRQALQSEIDNLKTMFYQQQSQNVDPYGSVNTYQQQQPNQQYYQQAYQQQQAAPIEQLWETDPKRAVAAQINHAFQTYDRINSYVEQQIVGAETRFPDFKSYREQVRNYINTIPVTDRAKPGIIDAAYFIVKGQNADTIADQARQAAIQQNAAAMGAQGISGGYAQQQQKNNLGLTVEEQNVARVMGLSDEEYAQNKKG